MNVLELIVVGLVIVHVIFTTIVYGIDIFENRNKKRKEQPQIQDKRCDNCGYEMSILSYKWKNNVRQIYGP